MIGRTPRSHPRRRWARIAVLVGLLGVLAGACAQDDTDSEEVRDVLDETALQAHRFVYQEVTPSGRTTVVQGIVEDDFRYQARLLEDGEPVLERVVSDDVVAVRFLQPGELGRFVDKDMTGLVDTETELDGISVFDALQARRWVVDPGGAPPQLVSVDAATDPGVDPIFDAFRQLGRARRATLATEVVFVEYDPDSISLVYRADEDPFPLPEEGSGVTRYDLVQPNFPTAAEAQNGDLPGEAVFRKMVVYVKDGQVIRVMEDIGLTPSRLDDFEDYMVRLVSENAPDQIRDGFQATVGQLEGEELGQFLLEGLNTFLDLRGDPRIRFRSTSYELLDVGDPSLAVELPEDDTIEADLAVLVNLGVKPVVDGAAGDEGDPADGSTDATTTGAPAAGTDS